MLDSGVDGGLGDRAAFGNVTGTLKQRLNKRGKDAFALFPAE